MVTFPMEFRRGLLLITILLLCGPWSVTADDVEDLLFEVELAVDDESYTRAISLLEDGKARFPTDYRISARAGRLYRDRELYRLALAELRIAEELAAEYGFEELRRLRFDIADVLGYLGDNQAAVLVLENLLADTERDGSDAAGDLRVDVIDDLSWLYFKTHQMDKGISMLEAALSEDFDRSWAHTLGTLYSGVYDKEMSERWYRASIDDALSSGDEYFASVAHYNLSLLEFTFYSYAEAEEQARRSLDLRNRSGGHMVLGELAFMAWDLPTALSEFRSAEGLDETPLAQVDLASFYRRIGRLDEALRYVERVAGRSDESWMYHYGLDRIQFGMDMGELQAELYRGLAAVEALTPKAGFGERLAAASRRLVLQGKALFHDRVHRSLTGRHSRELGEQENELDSEWFSFVAHRSYRRKALRHLERAKVLELSFAPEAEAWYQLEEGLERRDPVLTARALEGFRDEEGNPKERALRGLATMGRPSDTLVRSSLRDLYGMNPGGLRQYGLSLSIGINPVGDGLNRQTRRLTHILRQSGYKVASLSGNEDDADSILTIRRGKDDELVLYFTGPAGRTRGSARLAMGADRKDAARVLAGLLNEFYRTAIGGQG